MRNQEWSDSLTLCRRTMRVSNEGFLWFNLNSAVRLVSAYGWSLSGNSNLGGHWSHAYLEVRRAVSVQMTVHRQFEHRRRTYDFGSRWSKIQNRCRIVVHVAPMLRLATIWKFPQPWMLFAYVESESFRKERTSCRAGYLGNRSATRKSLCRLLFCRRKWFWWKVF